MTCAPPSSITAPERPVKSVNDRGILLDGFARAAGFNPSIGLSQDEVMELSKGEEIEVTCRLSSTGLRNYYVLRDCSTGWARAIPAEDIPAE